MDQRGAATATPTMYPERREACRRGSVRTRPRRRASPGSTADPRRFRPNLVVDTDDVPPAFLEDAWVGRVLRIGDTVEIRLSSKAPRCVMTTVQQPGLVHDPGILRAAATNRYDFPSIGTLACAGVYAEVAKPGLVRVGDPVSLR
jgi:uncharacterized protein